MVRPRFWDKATLRYPPSGRPGYKVPWQDSDHQQWDEKPRKTVTCTRPFQWDRDVTEPYHLSKCTMSLNGFLVG